MEDAKVPVVAVLMKIWKNGRDVDVMLKEPSLPHVLSAKYNCSDTANVVRYQG